MDNVLLFGKDRLPLSPVAQEEYHPAVGVNRYRFNGFSPVFFHEGRINVALSGKGLFERFPKPVLADDRSPAFFRAAVSLVAVPNVIPFAAAGIVPDLVAVEAAAVSTDKPG